MILQFKQTVRDSGKLKIPAFLGDLNLNHIQVIWRRYLNIKGCRKLLVLLATVYEDPDNTFTASLTINTVSKGASIYNGFGDYLYQGYFSVKNEAIMKLHKLKNEFETTEWYTGYKQQNGKEVI